MSHHQCTLRRVLLAACTACCGIASADEAVDFARDIQPILTAHCFECHGDTTQESGLRLDRTDLRMLGGNSGPAIVVGKGGDSLLIQAVRGGNDAVTKMPPEGPRLEPAQIAVLERWIDQGAVAPADAEPLATRRASDHWSFQPLAVVDPPAVQAGDLVRNPIDAFVIAKLAEAKLKPSPEADRATLIRRVSLDLIGLPPTVEDVDAFLADPRADAYERLVDRLLASPHYGERWGRQWLDVAHYADSNGYTIDGARSIWKYRDWVIDALNRDLPFDQFTIEQLAGDMLPGATREQQIATGFHRNTMVNEEGGTDKEQFRVEAVVDRISTTGTAFLGLTLGCARCHDHKFDPISQREFYQIFAIFNGADEPTLQVPSEQQAKELPALTAEIKQSRERLAIVDANSGSRQTEWETSVLAMTPPQRDALKLPAETLAALAVPVGQRSAEQIDLLRKEYQKIDPERIPLAERIAELDKQQEQMAKQITTTLVMRERQEPRETFIHVRGDFLQHGAPVQPAVPSVLPPIASRGQGVDRLDFARWLVDRNQPLTPRVTVNRIWQVYFGQGIVNTENDFGLQGDKPTHPELLDWLAGQFIAANWSQKALHRLIVTSHTYRQSSGVRAELAAADPYNKLLGRQLRLRLEAEAIRDSSLAASGLLTREIGGPGVYPPQPEGIYRFTQQVKFWGENKDADRYRRGVYTYLWRSSPYPFLKTFDVPDAVVACTRRPRSNTPLQSLTLANDRTFFEFAQGFAARLLTQSAAGDRDRAVRAFRQAVARSPSDSELVRVLEYLESQRTAFVAAPDDALAIAPHPTTGVTPAEAAAWTMVARVLLNLDEFITRE